MWWIDILLVVLACAFAGVSIYRGIKQHREGLAFFIIASIVLVALVAVPVESFEFAGTKVKIRGPRLRDVSIEIKSLSSQVQADDLSVFLVPAQNRGTVSDSGQVAKFDFKEIPEGLYHVLVADAVGHHSLLDPKTVAGTTLELEPIPRFPAEASVSGVVKQLGGKDRSETLVVVDDEVAWVDENGQFEISGLKPGNAYNLKVFGNDIANLRMELSGYEENLGTAIYAPDPVPVARICEEIEVRDEEDEWHCVERDYDRFPADVGRLWFYTRIQAVPPTEIVHRWRYGNQAVEVPLEIISRDFRTRSSRQIGGRVGKWTVEVLGPDKKTVLLSKSFEVGSD